MHNANHTHKYSLQVLALLLKNVEINFMLNY